MVWRGARHVRDEGGLLQHEPSAQSATRVLLQHVLSAQSATRVLWAAMLPRVRLGVSKLNSSWFPVLLEHELAAAGVALLGSLLLFFSSAHLCLNVLASVCACVSMRAHTHSSTLSHTRTPLLFRAHALLCSFPPPVSFPSPLAAAPPVAVCQLLSAHFALFRLGLEGRFMLAS